MCVCCKITFCASDLQGYDDAESCIKVNKKRELSSGINPSLPAAKSKVLCPRISAAKTGISRSAQPFFDNAAAEEKALEESWDKTRRAVEEAAKSPRTQDQQSFTEVTIPSEDVKLSPGRDPGEIGGAKPKSVSSSNAAQISSEAAPQSGPEQSSQINLDSKGPEQSKPAGKEAKEQPAETRSVESQETRVEADPGKAKPSSKESEKDLPTSSPVEETDPSKAASSKPEEGDRSSSQKEEASVEKPSSTATKEVAAQEKPESSSREPAGKTEATAETTSPQPDVPQSAFHTKEIEAIEREAEEGDGEEAKEYRHLLGEGVSTEDIAKRNDDKKRGGEEAEAPSKSKEAQTSPPKKPLPPPSIQVTFPFPSTPPSVSCPAACIQWRLGIGGINMTASWLLCEE